MIDSCKYPNAIFEKQQTKATTSQQVNNIRFSGKLSYPKSKFDNFYGKDAIFAKTLEGHKTKNTEHFSETVQALQGNQLVDKTKGEFNTNSEIETEEQQEEA